MYRFVIAFIIGLLFAPSAKSQVALEELIVSGQTFTYRNIVLCTGVTCLEYFSQSGEVYPFDINLLTIAKDDSDEAAPNKVPGVLACTGDHIIREQQAWILYRAVMQARFVDRPLGMLIADARYRRDQARFEFHYSDGSTARYYRSSTQFADTVGMIETVSPRCR